MLQIRDYEGVILVATIRRFFEAIARETNTLKLDLKPTEDDSFVGYVDERTHHMWIGFSIGMRHCERMFEAAGVDTEDVLRRCILGLDKKEAESKATVV